MSFVYVDILFLSFGVLKHTYLFRIDSEVNGDGLSCAEDHDHHHHQCSHGNQSLNRNGFRNLSNFEVKSFHEHLLFSHLSL